MSWFGVLRRFSSRSMRVSVSSRVVSLIILWNVEFLVRAVTLGNVSAEPVISESAALFGP